MLYGLFNGNFNVQKRVCKMPNTHTKEHGGKVSVTNVYDFRVSSKPCFEIIVKKTTIPNSFLYCQMSFSFTSLMEDWYDFQLSTSADHLDRGFLSPSETSLSGILQSHEIEPYLSQLHYFNFPLLTVSE